MSVAKIIDLNKLERIAQDAQPSHRTVVWTNGCFDILHVGHVRSLQAARRLGDLLVVGLNSDESVRRLKGPNRPIFRAEERAEMLAALACVDHVVVFDEPTPEAALSRLRPAFHCKGAEYGPQGNRCIPEADLVASYGGQVVFLPLVPEASTTSVLRRLQEDRP